MSDLLSITDAIETEIEAVRLIQRAIKGVTMDADDKELLVSAMQTHLMRLEELDETAQAAADEARRAGAQAAAAWRG
jgi:hypothetical protein